MDCSFLKRAESEGPSMKVQTLERRHSTFTVNKQGLLRTAYGIRHPHVVPFLRNKMPHSQLKTAKTFRRGCSVLNALNLKKRGIKIHNCALLLDFRAFFCYTTRTPLFSRISADKGSSPISTFNINYELK